MLQIFKQANLPQQEKTHIIGHCRQSGTEQSMRADKKAQACQSKLQLKIR